jgi:ferredoxin like protein
MKPLSVPERLTKNRFNLDEEECHIEVNQEIAKATGTGQASAPGALKWHYPRGGFGVQFREG